MTDRPTESGSETRPTDEITAKVVAKWFQETNPPTNDPSIDYYNRFWIEGGKVLASTRDNPDCRDYYTDDPRDDTDVALELLRWVELNAPWRCGVDETYEDGTWWKYQNPQGDSLSKTIPISGQPFRYAVVVLAAECLGVE